MAARHGGPPGDVASPCRRRGDRLRHPLLGTRSAGPAGTRRRPDHDHRQAAGRGVCRRLGGRRVRHDLRASGARRAHRPVRAAPAGADRARARRPITGGVAFHRDRRGVQRAGARPGRGGVGDHQRLARQRRDPAGGAAADHAGRPDLPDAGAGRGAPGPSRATRARPGRRRHPAAAGGPADAHPRCRRPDPGAVARSRPHLPALVGGRRAGRTAPAGERRRAGRLRRRHGPGRSRRGCHCHRSALSRGRAARHRRRHPARRPGERPPGIRPPDRNRTRRLRCGAGRRARRAARPDSRRGRGGRPRAGGVVRGPGLVRREWHRRLPGGGAARAGHRRRHHRGHAAGRRAAPRRRRARPPRAGPEAHRPDAHDAHRDPRRGYRASRPAHPGVRAAARLDPGGEARLPARADAGTHRPAGHAGAAARHRQGRDLRMRC